MKWAEVYGTHINTNLLETFTWYAGELRLTFTAEPKPVCLEDPDRKLYAKLCRQLGVVQAEAVVHGQGRF